MNEMIVREKTEKTNIKQGKHIKIKINKKKNQKYFKFNSKDKHL